jgi:hypothetical protein
MNLSGEQILERYGDRKVFFLEWNKNRFSFQDKELQVVFEEPEKHCVVLPEMFIADIFCFFSKDGVTEGGFSDLPWSLCFFVNNKIVFQNDN